MTTLNSDKTIWERPELTRLDAADAKSGPGKAGDFVNDTDNVGDRGNRGS